MRTDKKTFLTALAFSTMLMVTAPSDAATLKPAPKVDDTVIRLGDLFEDVGEKAGQIVMAAPVPGATERVTSYDLDRIAKEFELDWERPSFIRMVEVQREGTAFSLDDLEEKIIEAATQQGLANDVEVSIFGNRQGLYLPLDASVSDIEFERFNLNDRMDRFQATILIPTGGETYRKLKIGGNLHEVMLVPMLTRVIAPGEVIQEKDVVWNQYPARRLNRNMVLDQRKIVGQTVRRPMQAGQPLRENDVVAPVVIAKGTMVKMTISAGNLTLTTDGRALEDGGDNDMIRVMNTRSKGIVEAQVIAPGLVKVISNSVSLAAL